MKEISESENGPKTGRSRNKLVFQMRNTCVTHI